MTAAFHNLRYLRINARRLEHLATLALPVEQRTVLELGAGIGDLTSFFLDRGCSVTSVEPRSENIAAFRARYAESPFWPAARLTIIQADAAAIDAVPELSTSAMPSRSRQADRLSRYDRQPVPNPR